MMKRTLYCGATALLLIAGLALPVLASDIILNPDTIWLHLCLEGGTAEETFTVTSYYPQTVEVYVKDYENIPCEDTGVPVTENGWILQYGESATVTVVSTEIPPEGRSPWYGGETHDGWLGISVDDAVTHENLEYYREKVMVEFNNCQRCGLDLVPQTIELTMCQGETVAGTFTATSTCPQDVEADVMFVTGILPDGKYWDKYWKVNHVPRLDDGSPGGIFEYGQSETGTITITARNKDGSLSNPGVYLITLGYSVDDLVDNDNLDNPTEALIINVLDCEAAPEFPSALLPVTAIIAFLAAILYIRKKRES